MMHCVREHLWVDRWTTVDCCAAVKLKCVHGVIQWEPLPPGLQCGCVFVLTLR